MKIIISHDVDHLYWNDHLTDLFYPKLWLRESFALLRRRISVQEWALRMAIPFHRNLHHLQEVMQFDTVNGIPSTFFFGMANGLGLSYTHKQALKAIRQVQSGGFAAGVHGIAYDDAAAIQAEYQAFETLTGTAPTGIRMHYVRHTDRTEQLLSTAGYAFDSTVFDKSTGSSIQAPYPVGSMWEFPLTIMDTYLPYDLRKAQAKTRQMLDQAVQKNIGYCTVLFHDTNYSPAYQVYQDWYTWLIGHCQTEGFEFISFQEAIRELETVSAD